MGRDTCPSVFPAPDFVSGQLLGGHSGVPLFLLQPLDVTELAARLHLEGATARRALAAAAGMGKRILTVLFKTP